MMKSVNTTLLIQHCNVYHCACIYICWECALCMQLLLYSQTAKSTSMHCSDYKYEKNCNGQMKSNNCELIYATTPRYQVYLHIRTHKVNFDLHAPIFSELLIICMQSVPPCNHTVYTTCTKWLHHPSFYILAVQRQQVSAFCSVVS